MNKTTGVNPVADSIGRVAGKLATLSDAVTFALARAVLPQAVPVRVPAQQDARRVGLVRNKT